MHASFLLVNLPIPTSIVERHPAYSSTLLAFCGGPKVSGVLAEVRSNVELRKLCNCSDIIVNLQASSNHLNLFGCDTFLQSLLPPVILHINWTLWVKVMEGQSPRARVVLVHQKKQARKRIQTRVFVFGMWSEKKLLRMSTQSEWNQYLRTRERMKLMEVMACFWKNTKANESWWKIMKAKNGEAKGLVFVTDVLVLASKCWGIGRIMYAGQHTFVRTG